MDEKYDCLKLDNQICFPLYACSKEIIRRYRPMLDELDLTYTQYITMMVLWEKGFSSVNDLGGKLYLDSGTLTPVLKSLESKGYVARERSKDDERSVIISLTDSGRDLREKAVTIPSRMGSCIPIKSEDAEKLYDTLYEILALLRSDIKQ